MAIQPENPEVNYYPIIGLDSNYPAAESTAEKPQPNTANVPLTKENIVPAPGGSAMVNGDMWSPNYARDNSGWKLYSNGDAEFQNITARGTIVATSGRIANWYINTNTISSGAVEATSNVLMDSANSLIRLGSTSGNYILLDGANLRLRSSNYVAGVSGFTIEPGIIEAENLVARATLKGATFQYDVVSAVGGQLLVTNADTLASAMTAADNSTLTIKGNTTFAVNDMLYIRAITASGIQDEYLRVTNIGSAPTYTVTRDLAATYAANSNPLWQEGTTVVKFGKSDGAATYSGGWLRLIGEGTNAPYYSVFARNGLAYNNYAEAIRLGNLNGIGGFAADTYGIYIGDSTTGNYLSYDTVSGSLIVNDSVISNQDIYGNGSDGDVTISGNTTLTADMYYDNLVVDNGITLTTGGYRIFCKRTLTNNGTISCAGVAGGNGGNGTDGGAGGAAGTGGTALTTGSLFGSYVGAAGGVGATGGVPSCNTNAGNGVAGTNTDKSLGSAGKAGGAGNNGGTTAQCTTGTSGAGGTITSTVLNTVKNSTFALLMADVQGGLAVFKPSPASGGGGGGGAGINANNNANGSGGGGGGAGSSGGIMTVFARKLINNGTITVAGGAGGTGGNGSPSTGIGTNERYGGGGGGGGGGNGGIMVLVYSRKTVAGTTTITGGAAGAAGTNGQGLAATNGTAGSSGQLIELVV